MKKSLALVFILAGGVAFGKTILIDVEKRVPLYETREVTQKTKHCKGNSASNNIIGTVAGVAVGGVLGNQVGGGSGRTLATIAGAALGGYTGNKIEGNMKKDGDCYYKDKPTTKKIIVGYKNIGYYKTKQYSKISEEKLDSFKVDIDD